MDTSSIIGLLQESLFLIIVFCVFLIIAMVKGKYAIINTIFALYLALLVSLEFPYYDFFLNAGDTSGNAVVLIVIFIIFTGIGLFLFRKHIPGDDYENAFQHFNKKLILAIMATILIMAYSYQVLPVTELLTPGSPIHSLFAPKENFFWWLILPLVTLFFI